MADRLVLVPHETRQRAEEVGVVDHDFVRVGADRPRHLAGIGQLAERAIVEGDREGLDRAIDLACHQRGDGAAVEAARQEHAERHVRHQTQANGRAQQVPEPLDQFGFRQPRQCRVGPVLRDVPVLRDLDTAVLVHEPMARQELVDALEQRFLARSRSRGQQFRDGGVIRPRLDQAAFENGLDLRREEQPLATLAARRHARPVHRLLAHAVAREEQAPARRVPDGEREHAAEPQHAVVAPLLVGVNEHFSVGSRAVGVPGGFQLRPHQRVVVDLAVVGDPDAPVLVRQRLVAAREVDDAETPVGERRVVVRVQPGAVGAAMNQDIAHPDGT